VGSDERLPGDLLDETLDVLNAAWGPDPVSYRLPHGTVNSALVRPKPLAPIPVLLDAVYDPWPTPLAAAVTAKGGRVISGLQMLLHQAFAQVEQFTGLPAPREAMTCALEALD